MRLSLTPIPLSLWHYDLLSTLQMSPKMRKMNEVEGSTQSVPFKFDLRASFFPLSKGERERE